MFGRCSTWVLVALLPMVLLMVGGCDEDAPAPFSPAGPDAGAVALGPQDPRCGDFAAQLHAIDAKTLDPAAASQAQAALEFFGDRKNVCEPGVEWGVVKDAIAGLDNAGVAVAGAADGSGTILVQDASVRLLERMTGTNWGRYVPIGAAMPESHMGKAAENNPVVREAWKRWWKAEKNNRDRWLQQGRRQSVLDAQLEEQAHLMELQEKKLAVLHIWNLIPWDSNKLTPKDVIKRKNVTDRMLELPIPPDLVEEVKWGWYLRRKDGTIYRVLRQQPNETTWSLDAFKQEPTTAAGDPKRLLTWPFSDVLPLKERETGQEMALPPTFVDWLKKTPTVYQDVLKTKALFLAAHEGDRIYLLALRTAGGPGPIPGDAGGMNNLDMIGNGVTPPVLPPLPGPGSQEGRVEHGQPQPGRPQP